jgi:hypothetical protein
MHVSAGSLTDSTKQNGGDATFLSVFSHRAEKLALRKSLAKTGWTMPSGPCPFARLAFERKVHAMSNTTTSGLRH